MAIAAERKYEELTIESAIEFAKTLEIFSEDAVLIANEIGDGNLNYVFRIQDQNSTQSVIIKQALPYAKVVGESWPLTLERATIESNALKVQSQFVPNLVPKVYFTDETYAVTVMEDLSNFKILRTGLIEGQHYPKISEDIGNFLAHTLFHTSDFGLNQLEKKEQVRKFINPELCKITEDLIFTDPFYDHDTNDFESELAEDVKTLWDDHLLKLEVAKLKKKFLTQSEALLHGDLHTGSIFVTENETKVIDPEFAFYGPIGFDVGLFFGNILLHALSRHKTDHQHYLNIIDETWSTFSTTFKKLWEQTKIEPHASVDSYLEFILSQVFEDAIGFAGCEVIRRTIGLAHVADLDGIEDLNKRIKAKRQALTLGRALILQREKIKKPSDILIF